VPHIFVLWWEADFLFFNIIRVRLIQWT